jgi:antitoxin (DNA-binding transcriptional repressor) of toxin-antitoxin stability system
MAVYEIDYAKEHLTELFHEARQGFEVVITREDGKACELTPLAEVWSTEPAATSTIAPEEPEAATGDLVPA